MPTHRHQPPFCAQCKKLREPGYVLCMHHITLDRNRQTKKRLDQLAKGLCAIGACKNPHVPGKRSCQQHLDYNVRRAIMRKKKKRRELEELTRRVSVPEVRGQVGGL